MNAPRQADELHEEHLTTPSANKCTYRVANKISLLGHQESLVCLCHQQKLLLKTESTTAQPVNAQMTHS